MGALILDGKKAAAEITAGLKAKVSALREKGVEPKAAVIIAGNSPASEIYTKNLRKKCEGAGVCFVEERFPEDVTEEKLYNRILELNGDGSVHGIMIQMPLPAGIDSFRLKRAISPVKDTDGCTPENQGLLAYGKCPLPPCTPAGIIELLKFYGIQLKGMNAAIIGRSPVVGKPLALMLLNENAGVTVCHTAVRNIKEICRSSDIVISAAGKAGLVTGDYLKEGSVLVDAGISALPSGKICGDAVFEDAERICSYASPVPGGVGALTTTMALRNVIASAGIISGLL